MYRIVLNIFPPTGEAPESPGFAAASREVLGRFTGRFRGAFVTIVPRRFPDLPADESVGYVDCQTTDKSALYDVYRWTREGADGAADAVGELRVGIALASQRSADTLARARWVDLLADPVDTPEAVYPRVCAECGRPDGDVVPGQFSVSAKVAKKPTEMLRTANSICLMKPRVLSLFQQAAAGQFDSGPVVVAGRGAPTDWTWVRPTSCLDGRAIWHGIDPCPACGMPRAWTRRLDEHPDQPQLLRTFGPPDVQFARIERWPRLLKTHKLFAGPALVSGHLYAALLGEKVKGLHPPAEVFISVRPDAEEPTLLDP